MHVSITSSIYNIGKHVLYAQCVVYKVIIIKFWYSVINSVSIIQDTISILLFLFYI